MGASAFARFQLAHVASCDFERTTHGSQLQRNTSAIRISERVKRVSETWISFVFDPWQPDSLDLLVQFQEEVLLHKGVRSTSKSIRKRKGARSPRAFSFPDRRTMSQIVRQIVARRRRQAQLVTSAALVA